MLIVVLLVVLLLVLLWLIGRGAGETGGEQIEQGDAPTVEQSPEVTDGQTTAEEATE